jgi:hypothetical protein
MAWIPVSLGAMILIGFLSGIVGRRMRAMLRAAANDTSISLDECRRIAADAGLRVLIRTRIATALAIVLLMTTRPGMVGSLIVVGAAVAAALLWNVGSKRI